MLSYKNKKDRNEIALGALRIFTGGALLIKGFSFLINMHYLYELTDKTLPYSNFIVSHFVVFAHIVGGFCLMIGLLTRTSAIVNLPIILGAIIFVHAKEGLFGPTQGLELTGILLVVLLVLAVSQTNFMSVDSIINQHFKKLKDQGLVEHRL